MYLSGPVFQRGLHVDHRRQVRDIHLDRLGRIARLLLGLGHHSRNRIADMAHLALGQNRMRRFLHRLRRACQ